MRLDVDTDDVEAGPVVSHGGAAGTAEQVEQQGPIMPDYQDSWSAHVSHVAALLPSSWPHAGQSPSW
jgi:hypothetical protein